MYVDMYIYNVLIKKNHVLVKSKSHIWQTIATALLTHLKPMFPEVETNQFICTANQLTGFFKKENYLRKG